MNYEIVNVDKKLVSGLGTLTTNENNKAMKDIGEIWQKLIEENVFHKISGAIDKKGIALYTDYEGDYTKPYYFLAGCEVEDVKSNIEKGFDFREIPEGKYAKFTVQGDVKSAVIEVWENIWKLNLDRKYSCDFEVYHNDSEDMNNQIIDIYISLN
ncbi:GyrI-like domain-containing protein [Clostridium amazonitimonense]|uniref:GyrI-like domain-containing protein n=1 Tax=Clostridium amazonitimonense TaxID=1499689 RepID=UPI000509FFDB|nr:GyrI-like domain-containing protein [Clostridium amazonitimonense]